ncbi:hypothetical protein [Bifidobacterium sp. ESL0745]|uniref:hypothetical protein n=1 Tax=Bifidobacterium sp. ESL0745 TaxID=2983226 RepID=UPI0023F990B3|nr:hypothetical protein [Bifidobacterium sp. ESL0745]MDF7665721.1 hypothetical protein [Bifidobacterium sp. ESL0745]
MARGGARARSGPSFDPNSERSERLGRSLVPLSAKGYKYRPKAFPLAPYEIIDTWKTDDGLEKEVDTAASEAWNKREKQLWRELWKLPQAIAWHMPQYAYLFHTVALYCRQFVICESSEAKAADRATLQRYADTIGLTPQGLKLNGWEIVDDTVKHQPKTGKTDSNVVHFPSARERYAKMEG